MGVMSAFITLNYRCKPLMTDVTVIHKNKNKVEKRWHLCVSLIYIV